MSIDRDYVVDIAPEFASEDTARIDRFIARAAPFVDRTKWGAKADLAHALMTAHLLTSSAQKGLTNVVEEKVGDLSRKFSTGQSGSDATGYLSQFNQMKRTLLIGPVVSA